MVGNTTRAHKKKRNVCNPGKADPIRFATLHFHEARARSPSKHGILGMEENNLRWLRSTTLLFEYHRSYEDHVSDLD